jgi:hypothetical protein
MAIPKNVEIPRGSGQFAKLQDGKNNFRVLSDVVVGWELWKDKKPIRHEGAVCKFKPEEADVNQNGKPNINYFWAMAVWNYADKKVQTLEITQKTIMKTLYELEQNPKWGDLKRFDIEITKTKDGDKTSYVVLSNPPEPLEASIAEAYQKTPVDLTKLFDGKYPIQESSSEIEVNPEDIPF